MKKLFALLLALVMVFALAACGPKTQTGPGPASNPGTESTPPSEAQTPSGNEGGEKVYTTVISEADVTLTVSADQKSITVDAMGMTVKGSCEVVGNVLTVKEQTEGNAQVWASLAQNTFTLNDDGTATAVPAGEGGGEGGSAAGVARFAGEYDLYSEEKDMYCEEFIIDEDGTVHGVVEGSGMTAFEGTVTEDGTITAEVTRLGGTMTGTITDDLQVTVHFEVRGSTSDFVGGPL